MTESSPLAAPPALETTLGAAAGRETAMERESARCFERLLAREGAALERVAASYEPDAVRRQDLFQEICLAIWQALPRFRGDSTQRTFVFRIAHNRALSALARRRPRRAILEGADLEAAEQVADPALDPAAVAEGRQRRVRLAAALRSLPLGLRQVLTMTLEGLSQREIGEVLGIRENNVAVRATRARQALRRALGEEERR